MITDKDIQLALESLEFALEAGASKARATLSKSTEDLVATLDGEVDRVTRCADCSLSIAIFADGRYGSFSTNKFEREALRSFIGSAVATVKMLAPDTCRDLPDKTRYCTSAISGSEMGISDSAYFDMTPERRKQFALDAVAFPFTGEGFKLISEEGEYSDSHYDLFVCDTAGLRCRHTETSFEYGVEVTIEDGKGNKYNDYWWTAAPLLEDYDASQCGLTAIQRAAAQIGSKSARSGKYNMVVSTEVASKMVSPILRALSAYSIQQNDSFLTDSLGKAVFPEGLTIIDEPHLKGQTGSKLFDSEGVASLEGPIIEAGVVKQYFVNTYMAAKMGLAPTSEEAMRPRVAPWPKPGLDRDAIMQMCGSGILVTEFNGGNCNSATGDFSYGVSGQKFKNGKIVGPLSGMVVTGNFLTLWQNLIAAGEDYRTCMSKLIPTLAFSNVDFSG